MSLYKHNYSAYTGKVTPLWSRVGVLARYGLDEVWSSKIAIGLFVLSLLPFLVFVILIYLANNPLARALIVRGSSQSLPINEQFFLVILEIQSWFALAITSWIAPRVITFDLADNALPILLSHPISRAGYVFGKFLAMVSSLSLITWLPCLLLFLYQSYASPTPWMMDHLAIGFGLVVGSMIWIAFLSLVGLALSSWVKWRVVATGAIFAAVFVPAGVGGVVTAILRTRWGFLLNVPMIMTTLWRRMLGAPEMFGSGRGLPTPAIISVLVLACCGCVAILSARVRAREVVRG